MLCFPNAKINIGLNVIEKRSDGFHNIETIFYPIPLCDALEITNSNILQDYQFSTTGIPVTIEDHDNIVMKAFQLLKTEFAIPPTAIHLHKNIPFGAGLGGGSADAAFMIKLLNDQYHLKLSESRMEQLAGMLGSDCPFFIQNKAVFAEGKGDIFSKVSIDLSNYFIYLIKPNLPISTPEAYRCITPKYPDKSLRELIQQPIELWKDLIFNDFEDSIFPKHEELRTIKDMLYKNGAIYAAMSGSGSSIYGIFKHKPLPISNFKNHFTWISHL
ncbi:4-(cytidine 5'-diphospho)-2-C-methyl-D-erythritol kinase [Ancylomarina longa]|uniref:4-diphosphocytidyl-2-C-methyl-D-erythritol kinase n=1 Tax=Ancylomarina longa TaxID=2487017 RepID=A0A434AVR3_9BACT|nr:4-(cytidine 5'-diphospho)-2-C-methyl-D-erythritol kinase [Ancylomarina longa]RUT78473.1 4-(cytidine 5'-diphospho)-2-C-methyl-D-erythritol kinase [Ancylomarina longa]